MRVWNKVRVILRLVKELNFEFRNLDLDKYIDY